MLLGAACPAFAGKLSIRIRATPVVDNHVLKSIVQITNQGNEDAFHVQMKFLLPSEPVTFPEVSRLNVNESKTFSSNHHLGSIKNGTHPLPIMITFHDVNLYPFSALSCPTFSVGQESKGGITHTANPFTVGKEGTAVIYLENSESESKNLTATLILPKEFASSENGRKINLGPGERKTVSFSIVNLHALPGATYPIFCLFQHDAKGLHHTTVCQVMTTVTEGKNWFYRTRWVWLAAGAVLALFMVGKGWLGAGS